MEQAYDIRKSYQANYSSGPQIVSPPPVVPSRSHTVRFLGLELQSKIGIAAGLLLNSRWVATYADRGFDILTYKTVRSSYRPCYPLPNWVYVQEEEGAEDGRYVAVDGPGCDPENVSSSVCFGIPSMDPEVWRGDVAAAKAALSKGQMLIVSVVASPEEGWGRDDLAADFVCCAEWAVDAGADAIEANFSCPNVCSAEGSIYRDSELSGFIAGCIREAIGDVPLLVKTGAALDFDDLRGYLRSLDGIATAVTIANCLVRPVVHPDGTSVFGPDYREAGVLGRAIHRASVDSVSQARSIISTDGLDLEIAAVGGVSTCDDMDRFLSAGADAILLGSSPMYLPNIAMELRELC